MEPGGGGELQVGGGGGWVEGLSVIMKLTSHFNDEAARLSLCVNRRDRMGEQHNYTRVIRGGREGRGEGGKRRGGRGGRVGWSNLLIISNRSFTSWTSDAARL